MRALSARGIDTPFAVQAMVIPDASRARRPRQVPHRLGQDASPSASRWSTCSSRRPRPAALVLAPTRELAPQIVDELRGIAKARGLNVAAVYGGVAITPQIKAAKPADILVATPGRLIDLLDAAPSRSTRIEILVLDEADRMLDMGFKPAVDRIVKR